MRVRSVRKPDETGQARVPRAFQTNLSGLASPDAGPPLGQLALRGALGRSGPVVTCGPHEPWRRAWASGRACATSGPLRHQPRAAGATSIGASCNALLAQQRLECATLSADDGGLGSLDQPELLGDREPAPRSRLDGFVRRRDPGRLMRLGCALHRGDCSIWISGWLGHASGTILRPSVQRYRGATVSSDVGT